MIKQILHSVKTGLYVYTRRKQKSKAVLLPEAEEDLTAEADLMAAAAVTDKSFHHS